MGVYRVRDLLRVPGLLSLSRVPLAAAFPLVAQRPAIALAVLVAAGLSDVLDGWYARRFGQVTATGAAIDPTTDKVFVLTVVITLVVLGRLSWVEVLLLSTRELGELPLVLWIASSRRARTQRAAHPSANALGKLGTVSQFAAATAALFRLQRETHGLVIAASFLGVVAAANYWLRAFREARAHSREA
jgi:CDP-diacylglycerol--glycerol-3-phosphate 3-phosphatidyltransferase/cardiolipin synthase